MANSYYLTGTGNWMKILGEPVQNYAKDGREWTMDITPDKDGTDLLKKLKLGDRIKDKDDERGKFIQFRQREKKANGDNNRRITVVDAANRDWPQDKLIGNGSIVEVKFKVKDYGPGKKIGLYPQAVRVLKHVEFKRQEFAPLPEDSEYHIDIPLDDEDFSQDPTE